MRRSHFASIVSGAKQFFHVKKKPFDIKINYRPIELIHWLCIVNSEHTTSKDQSVVLDMGLH